MTRKCIECDFLTDNNQRTFSNYINPNIGFSSQVKGVEDIVP